MVSALISNVREQLVSFLNQEKDLGSFLLETVKQGVGLFVGGLDEKVQKLITNFEDIQAVLEDAEKKQVKTAEVQRWLKKLKDLAYDVEDMLEEWNTAKLKSELERQERDAENGPLPKKSPYSFSSSSARICQQFDIGKRIKEFNERLHVITIEKDRYKFEPEKGVEEPERLRTVSFVNEENVHGRDDEKRSLVNLLLRDNSTPKKLSCLQGPKKKTQSRLHFISVVGMGGIGKTTLAQLVFNDSGVRRRFKHRIWVCVSDPFDEIRIAKAILESIRNEAPNLEQLETLLRNVRDCVSGKRILLVLDDVWTDDPRKWEQLNDSLELAAPGSRILITTRNEVVATTFGTLPENIFVLRNVSQEECWLLFSRMAFQGKTEEECETLEDTGKKIVEKCKGLPLAVKFMGGLMRSKRTEIQWQSIAESEIWKLDAAEKGLFPPLLLSYYDLPSALKRCFSYCAVFPKDKKIRKDQLINLWMAQGYVQGTDQCEEMEILGEEYFEELVRRSFFHDFTKDINNDIISFKMHGIVHDFALFLTKTVCLTVADNGDKELVGEETHHLSLISLNKNLTIPRSIHGKKLRSLLIDRLSFHGSLGVENASLSMLFDQLTNESLSMLFNQLPHLIRAINLGDCLFDRLPESIERLIHLKYLNLSNNGRLIELPEVVCDLCNLQTLDLKYCTALQKLPSKLGKLHSLRCLRNKGLSKVRCMPRGVGRLTCLRTMDVFVADGGSGTASLRDLADLTHIRGHLKIIIVENASNREAAGRAKLDVKKCVVTLELYFSRGREEDQSNETNEGDAFVLEALQPPPNLEGLKIHQFGGPTEFPNWIMSLTKLKTIVLSNCAKWDCLPPFGKLFFLEELVVQRMNSVKRVGVEFLGVEGEGGASSSSSSSIIAFPKLRVLQFFCLAQWEEWDYRISSSSTRTGESISIMPNLQFLAISGCPMLKALPSHVDHNTRLTELYIDLFGTLPEFWNNREAKIWLEKANHVEHESPYSYKNKCTNLQIHSSLLHKFP